MRLLFLILKIDGHLPGRSFKKPSNGFFIRQKNYRIESLSLNFLKIRNKENYLLISKFVNFCQKFQILWNVSNHKIAFLIFNKYCSILVRNLKFSHIFAGISKISGHRISDSWKRWSRHFISFAKNPSKDFLNERLVRWSADLNLFIFCSHLSMIQA